MRYVYDSGGMIKAVKVRDLLVGECPCKYDGDPMLYVDGSVLYRKIVRKQ